MLLLYGLAMTQIVLFGVTTYVVGRALGMRIHIIGLGSPPILRVRRADPEVRIGPLPSASVDYGSTEYRDLSRARRLVITLAPWLVVLAIAIACLGAGPALRTFARGFVQFVATVDVTPLVRAMIELARTAPLEVTAGIMAAKIAALNLLPFGGLAGAATLRELLTPQGRGVAPSIERYIAATMLLFMLWTVVRFGWAFIQIAT